VVLVPPKNERCKNAVEKPHFRPGSGTADPDERILSDQDQDLEQAEAEGKSRRTHESVARRRDRSTEDTEVTNGV
jgi:hypothetical protein